jgi:hypothetical protein
VAEGFHIVDDPLAAYKQVICNNYKSATDPSIRSKVEKQIKHEIDSGNYVIVDKRPTIVSALGAIPKPNGDIRLIHDASRPLGSALNDFATVEKQSFQSLQDLLDLAKPGYFMFKVDLKSAYRSVKVHESNYHLTGLHWKFSDTNKTRYMIDTRLMFGSSKAPSAFHRLTQAVRRMMAARGYNIVAYLDDFAGAASTLEECCAMQRTLISLLRELGFSINWNKVEGPSQTLTFLGISINTVYSTLTLPPDKLEEFKQLLLQFKCKRRATALQLQSLAGKLNWATQAVTGGRCFLRRILDCINLIKSPKHKLRLTPDFKLDIIWWLEYAIPHCGKTYYCSDREEVHVLSDASNFAAGVYSNNDWLYTNFANDWPEIQSEHINYKEVAAALTAIYRWAPMWQNKKVIIHMDSITAKAIMNKGTCKNKIIMAHLRQVVWLTIKFNFQLQAIYVPGRFHDIPDSISRLHGTGQLIRLDSLFGFTMHPVQFLAHMSLRSFWYIFPQICKWQQVKANWMQRGQNTGHQPSQVIQGKPRGHILRPTWPSVT